MEDKKEYEGNGWCWSLFSGRGSAHAIKKCLIMKVCSNEALYRLSLTRVQAITYCDLDDKRRWNRADKRDQGLRRPAVCSQLVSIHLCRYWMVREISVPFLARGEWSEIDD